MALTRIKSIKIFQFPMNTFLIGSVNIKNKVTTLMDDIEYL